MKFEKKNLSWHGHQTLRKELKKFLLVNVNTKKLFPASRQLVFLLYTLAHTIATLGSFKLFSL